MDPEVIAQLEEQLRLMTEMLAQQNRTMASKIDSTTTSLNSSLSGLNRSLGSSTRATTKYEEAVHKASEKTTESADRWNKALGGSVDVVNKLSIAFDKGSNVLGTFAGALLSTEKGFSKYGATVEGATGAVTSLASAVPLVGTTLGAASKLVSGVFTKLVGDGLKLVDAIVTLRDETVKTAGAMPVTSEGLLQLANNAKYFGDNIQVLGKITQGLGTGLVTLGNTAGQGAVKFMELANVSEETRQAFGKMGISQEELTQMQATYIKQQQSSGLAYLSQNKSIDQLRRESLKYAENLNALSSLTGKQADSLRAEQEIAAAVMQEKVAQRQDMIELKRLKDAGLTAEAADLEAKIKSMASYRDTMANLVGPEQTAQYMNYMRTGVFNNISAPLAVLGVDLEKARTQLVSGVDGMEVAAQSANNLREAQDSQLSALNEAALHMEADALSGLGQNKEALTRLSDTYGKSYEEMLAAAKKLQEERKQGSPIDNTIEQVRATERMLQQRYQEFLMDGIKKAAAFLEKTDLTKLASEMLNSAIANFGTGLMIATGALVGVVGLGVATALSARKAQDDFTKALRDSSDALRKQHRASNSATSADIKEAEASRNARAADIVEARASDRARGADIAEARASGSAASADMREASASQRAASADIREAAESMKAAAADLREARASDAAAAADRRESMSGGGAPGMLGNAGRLLGKLAPWATAGMVAYDAFGGFTADPNASLVDKLKNAGSSALSGVSFGLLGSSPAEIAEKSAKESLSESNNESLSNQLAILNSASSTGGVASMTPEQLAAYGISPESAPVVAQEPDTAEKEKAAQAESAKQAGYTIQKGDTLSKLAEKYSTTVEALMEANKQITNKDLIYEGTQLNIPKVGDAAIQGLGGAALMMSNEQLAGIGMTGVVSGIPGTEVMDPEDIEKVQSDVLRRNREANEEVVVKTKVDTKLLETTIKYDTTLNSTNKALDIFKGLVISLNSVLGGVDENGNPAALGGGMGAMGGMQFGGETDKILATIKQMESGNDYQAQNPTSSASGAYQFIDSTWQSLTKKAGIGTEFKSAKEAPAAIQDQIAKLHLQEIIGKAGGDISKIPTAWFTGNVQGKSSAVSPEKVQAYVQKWMGIYGSMPGGANMAGGMPGRMGGTIGLLQMMNQSGYGMMGGMMGGGQAAALALASQYLGMSEGKDRQAIAAFLKAGGAGLDPKVEAWCAAFVNSSLQQAGIRGSGSAIANSFQNWGIGVPINQVMPGDVVLETRGKSSGQTGGHVGLGTGKYDGKRIGMLSGNSDNKVTDKMIPADGDVMVRRGQLPMAEKGGVFKGPDSGYLAMLHGKEAVVPLDNKFTRSQARMQSFDQYTVNGKPVDQKAYDSFMKANPELQNIKQKVQSMLGAINNDRIDPAKMIGSMSQLIDSNLTGVKDEIIDKNKKIQDSLIQMVSRETTKALQSMNETNQPMQNAAMEISRSMKSVMNAHTESMNELTYRLGRMIDVLEAGNDVSKKILKKASA
jgi:uncharacterized protein (TIGR02594 family)